MRDFKLFFLMICISVLSSCSLNVFFVSRKSNKFEEAAQYMIQNNIKSISTDTIKDASLRRKFKKLRVDGADLGNTSKRDWEPKDSVVQFINSGSFPFIRYKCILYDFHKYPKIYNDTIVKENRTKIFKRVKSRFYLSKDTWGDV